MKKLLTILFVVAMVACLTASLVACGEKGDDNNGDTSTTYTVTVTCDDDIVLATVQVKLVSLDDVDVTSFVALSNGVATFSVDAGTYKVVLSGLLDRFDVPNVTLTPLVKDATVALTLKSEGGDQTDESLTVSLTVKNSLKKVVAQLPLQVCSTGVGSTCTSSVTDENGVATLSLKAGEYEVHIEQSNLPENTYFNNTTKIVVSQSSTEFTVYLDDAHTYTVCVETVAGAPVSDISIALQDLTDGSDLVLELTTGENGKASVVGPKQGWGFEIVLLNCPANYTYETRYIDRYEDNITIVLKELGSSSDSCIVIAEGVETTIYVSQKRPYAWIAFDHKNVAGEYRIESFGNLDTTCKHYTGAGEIVEERGGIDMAIECAVDNQDNSADDKNFTLEFAINPEYVGEGNCNIYAFKVGANNVVGTQSFVVKITFIKSIEAVVYQDATPQATQVKSAIDAPKDSKFAWVPYGDGYTVAYNEDDGYYHLNGVDGPIVFVPVAGSKHYPRSFDTDFMTAYYSAGSIGFIFVEGTYKNDYGQFLQTYAQSANDDGLTPLTQELKNFLQYYCLLNGVYASLNWDKNVEPDNLYYFACCYYQNIYRDVVFGDGTAENPYGLVQGSYKFEMSANEVYNFVLSVRNFNEHKVTVEGATLKNSSGEVVDQLVLCANETFSVVKGADDESATVVVNVVDVLSIPVEGGSALSLGDQTVYGTSAGVAYTFTAEQTGVYEIFSPDAVAYIYIQTSQGIEVVDAPISLQAGQTITFVCSSYGEDTTYVLSIVMD